MDLRSLFHPVLREVVAEGPLADAHQLGGVLLHAAAAVEGAADILGINRNTLRKKITALGIPLKK